MELKSSELRIGNWVFDPISKTEMPVDAENIHWLAKNEINDFSPFPYSPIALTEEWLLKFGWIWNQETNSYEKFPNGDARMHLRKTTFGYEMFNYVLNATIAQKIYHAHQLQNLYFALTGEELQIKETAQ